MKLEKCRINRRKLKPIPLDSEFLYSGNFDEMYYEDCVNLIERLRRIMIVSSGIYYQYGNNVMSDHRWATLAKLLVRLSEEFPCCARDAAFDKEFKGFDGSTGFDLPYNTPEMQAVCERIMRMHDSGGVCVGNNNNNKKKRNKRGFRVVG